MPSNPLAKLGDKLEDAHEGLSNHMSNLKKEHPLRALRSVGDKLRPHTAVADANRPPGDTKHAKPAGTAIPVTHTAGKQIREPHVDSYGNIDDGGRRDSVSSMSEEEPDKLPEGESGGGTKHQITGKPGTQLDDSTTVGQDRTKSDLHSFNGPTQEGTRHEPQKEMFRPTAEDKHSSEGTSAKRRDRFINTESRYDANPDQQRRADKVREFMREHRSHHGKGHDPLNSGDFSDLRDNVSRLVKTKEGVGDEASTSNSKQSTARVLQQQQQQPIGQNRDTPGDVNLVTDLPGQGISARREPTTRGKTTAEQPHSVSFDSSKQRDQPGYEREKALSGKVTPSEDLPESRTKDKLGQKSAQLEQKRIDSADYMGWKQVAGWDERSRIDDNEAKDLLQRSTLLEEYISDKYIGDWYQNTILIVSATAMGWIIGWLGFSISWLSIVLMMAASVYRTSIRRLRRNCRDDVLRDLTLRSMENDSESMEWFNSFLVKFWLIYEPFMSERIASISNSVLREQSPGFIESMSLEKLTFGTKAPRIEYVRTFPKTDPKIVVMDWSVSFTPNDVIDMTARQLKNKVNPKIQLDVKVGKSILSKTLPILLEDLSFTGACRLRIALMDHFPHVRTVDFSFLEPPKFDFSLKPIGGDTFGIDVVKVIPGLANFIQSMVHASLGPMMYAPNAFQINVEQMMQGVGIMSGVGVLVVNLKSARNLSRDRVDGRVDPYVRIMSPLKEELARSKIKNETMDPVWDETLFVIIKNVSQTVILEVLDFQVSVNDRSIGIVSIPIEKVAVEGTDDFITERIFSGGRETGEITFGCHFSPVQMPEVDEAGNVEAPRDSKTGILALRVLSARDLDPKWAKTAKLNTYCEIEIDGHLFDTTKIAKASLEPDWNYFRELIIKNKTSTQVTLRVRDDRGKNSPQIGVLRTRLASLLISNEKQETWFPMEPKDAGEIRVEAQWKPVTLGGSVSSYIEPIGVVRLNIKHAEDLRNLEHVGKIDPYVRVFLNRSLVAKTGWFQNNLNPVWNEVLYVPIQNELQRLTIEVMDVEKRSRDRSLGSFSIELDKVIERGEDGKYKVFVSSEDITSRLVMPNRGPKGTVTFSMEFFPAINVAPPSERDYIKAQRNKIDELQAKLMELDEHQLEELQASIERLELVGIDMPLERQLSYNSGILAFNIESVTGAYRGQRLRVTCDNRPQPVYISPMSKGGRLIVGESGDILAGQFDLSSLRFQIVNSDDDLDNPGQVHGEITIGCKNLLKETFEHSRTYFIGEKAKITLRARFFPVPDLLLDDDEDISNNGCLEVHLKRGNNLEAADTSGTSDPYCSFYLNNDGVCIYKSATIKKTLNPVWNEQFRFDIADIRSLHLKALVYDWDMGNPDDFLGGHIFDLSELEPLEWRDYKVDLVNVKKTKDVKNSKSRQGTLEISLRFNPGVLHTKNEVQETGVDTVTKVAIPGVRDTDTAAPGEIGGDTQRSANDQSRASHSFLGRLSGRLSVDSKAASMNEGQDEYSLHFGTVTGLAGHKTVQLRAFVIARREKEIFRSKSLSVENGKIEINDGTETVVPSNGQIGLKIKEVKGLGRFNEIGQSMIRLIDGSQKVDLGGITVELNIMRL